METPTAFAKPRVSAYNLTCVLGQPFQGVREREQLQAERSIARQTATSGTGLRRLRGELILLARTASFNACRFEDLRQLGRAITL